MELCNLAAKIHPKTLVDIGDALKTSTSALEQDKF